MAADYTSAFKPPRKEQCQIAVGTLKYLFKVMDFMVVLRTCLEDQSTSQQWTFNTTINNPEPQTHFCEGAEEKFFNTNSVTVTAGAGSGSVEVGQDCTDGTNVGICMLTGNCANSFGVGDCGGSNIVCCSVT